MTTVAFRNAEVLIDGRFEALDVEIDRRAGRGRIVALTERDDGTSPAVETVDVSGRLLVPGFIDLQCNGAVGIDVTTEPHRIAEVAAALPRFGVTAFLPTVVTAPATAREAAIRSLPLAQTAVGDGGAFPLGLHLEGPLISTDRLGAHPRRHVLGAADIDGELEEWIESGCVAMVTLAPELDGMIEVIGRLSAAGIVVSAGHTTMSRPDLARAEAAGLRYVTHLFNAMSPFSHRDPGPIGAALTADAVVGLICDGLHVDPVAVAMAWRALGPSRTSLVSDAVAALGQPFGPIQLGEFTVHHDETGVRTVDGVLAGSSLPLDQAVRNLVAFTGCGLDEALGTVTTVPAALLGAADRGRIAVGARADLVVLDRDGNLEQTWIAGRPAWSAASRVTDNDESPR
jgi:N-acetylglucosamine-6-phosphate deacetylase